MFAFKNKSILVAIFVLVFVITFLTPMHSDDYAYFNSCLLYTSPSPRDVEEARMPSSA